MVYPQVQIGELVEVSWTPALDTSQFADDDLMQAAVNELEDLAAYPGQWLQLIKMELFDASDQGAALDVWLFDRAPTLGSANAAFAISDAHLLYTQGVVRFVAADYNDAANGQYALQTDLYEVFYTMRPTRTSTSLYAVLVSRGTGTYAADGLTIRATFRRIGPRIS